MSSEIPLTFLCCVFQEVGAHNFENQRVMEHVKQDTEKNNSRDFCLFLRNLLQVGKRFAVIITGSSSELPIQYRVAYATDWDFMHIPTDICALPFNISTPSKFRGTRFTIGTIDKYPGFARLYAISGKRLHRPKTNISSAYKTRGPAYTRSIICQKKVPVDFIF